MARIFSNSAAAAEYSWSLEEIIAEVPARAEGQPLVQGKGFYAALLGGPFRIGCSARCRSTFAGTTFT